MTKKLTIKHYLVAAFLLRLFLLFISSSHPDLGNHIDWGNRFWQCGPKKFYENIFWSVSWPNQPIASIFLFAILSKLNQMIFGFFAYINQSIGIFPSAIIPVLESQLHIWLVKMPSIITDITLAYLIYQIIKQRYRHFALKITALFLFNPIVIYNSTIWGQTDSLVNLFAVLGLYLIYRKKIFWGIQVFLTGFLFKLSLIIYFPIFLILLLQAKKYKSIFLSTVFWITLTLFFASFFTPPGKTVLNWINYLYTNRILPRQGHMLNGNAFNVWFLIYGLNLSQNESIKILGLSAQLIGRLVFIFFNIPILIMALKRKLNLKRTLVSCLLVSFSAFLLLTNMHERYLYPIFPILTILLGLKSNIISAKNYLILSAIHLLNLYNLWFYPPVSFLRSLLQTDNYLFPKILSLALLYYYLTFYIKYIQDAKNK